MEAHRQTYSADTSLPGYTTYQISKVTGIQNLHLRNNRHNGKAIRINFTIFADENYKASTAEKTIYKTIFYMRVDIITTFPEMMESFFNSSIMGRAQRNGYAEICLHNLRDYTTDKHRKTDDYPFGGCAGLVMKIEPIDNCIKHLKSQRNYDEVIYTTPDGQVFDQPMANSLSMKENLIFLCGHYKGIDHRIREHLITKEISIGDYVLTGGELAVEVICDAVIRLIPGVISDETSALSDSFQDNLLAPPVYTRPAEYNGWKVPDVLLSGHEAKIRQWEFEQSMERTKLLRPDLLK